MNAILNERQTVNIHGNRMVLHEQASDVVISRELAEKQIFEPFETKLVLENICRGDWVIDVGANIGYYTLLFAQKVGQRGRVFAFEPDPENFELLEHNVRQNGYDNVVLVNKAVAEKTG